MQRVLVDRQVRYCYQIDNQYYLTVGPPLSEEAAYHIVGRATRVWVVILLLPHADGDIEVGGQKFRLDGVRRVLKDVWLYEETPFETQIQKRILDKLHNESKGRRLKWHFLTFIAEEVVAFQGKERRTRRCKDGDWEQVDWHTNSYFNHNTGATSSRTIQDNASQSGINRMRIPGAHSLRKHVRSVVKEECKSLYELTDFKDAVRCWRDMIVCMFFRC